MSTIKDEEELYQNLKNLSIIYIYLYEFISKHELIDEWNERIWLHLEKGDFWDLPMNTRIKSARHKITGHQNFPRMRTSWSLWWKFYVSIDISLISKSINSWNNLRKYMLWKYINQLLFILPLNKYCIILEYHRKNLPTWIA